MRIKVVLSFGALVLIVPVMCEYVPATPEPWLYSTLHRCYVKDVNQKSWWRRFFSSQSCGSGAREGQDGFFHPPPTFHVMG